MKIIEGLKKAKDLQRKADDIRRLVENHCALSNIDTPHYPDQAAQIDKWVQAHRDVLKEILRLRVAIARTNLETIVEIDLSTDDHPRTVTKSIAEWIHRRRDLAQSELSIWKAMSDRNIREGTSTTPSGDALEVKLVRYYNPATQNEMIDRLRSEPTIIDSKLEVVNAITDLIE